MTTTLTAPMTAPTAPTRPNRAPRRLSRWRLAGWSLVFTLTWPIATALFCVWITFAALSPLTLVLPVTLAVTVLVRTYANAHRRWAEAMLGEPIPTPYRRPVGEGLFARARTVLTDRASWRDALWLLVQSTAGAVLAITSFAMLAGAAFYAIYPFLYAVTPQDVFGQPFGDWLTLHSVGDAFVTMPAALVLLGLWFVTVRPFALAQARMARALLT